jgi:GMP synthase (glutamine-hydrolysing)
MMMSVVLVIKNDAKEGAGQLGSLLYARGFEQRALPSWEADYASISPSNYSGLVVLGGAQGAYETDTYPYLIDEIRLIQSFVDAGLPVIGLCLGAQLLASALGGEVRQNVNKELGWHDIQLNDDGLADPLMEGHPKNASAFHFHGDYFRTPPGCVNLVSSDITHCQLFRFKENVYGFQYHVEVDLPLIEVMCLNNVDYMAANGADAHSVVDKSKALIDEYMRRSAVVLNSWIDKLEETA